MKKTSTCFLLYAFNWPNMNNCLEKLDFQKCPGTFFAECIQPKSEPKQNKSIITKKMHFIAYNPPKFHVFLKNKRYVPKRLQCLQTTFFLLFCLFTPYYRYFGPLFLATLFNWRLMMISKALLSNQQLKAIRSPSRIKNILRVLKWTSESLVRANLVN